MKVRVSQSGHSRKGSSHGEKITAEDKRDLHISVKVKSEITGEEEKFSPKFWKDGDGGNSGGGQGCQEYG